MGPKPNMFNPMNTQRGPMMGGAPGMFPPREKKTPHEGYVCNRCHVPGHFIHDCPKNNDPNYDPSRYKGVPKSLVWRNANACPEWFMNDMQKVMQSLVKQKNLYMSEELDSSKPQRAQNPGRFPPSLLC